MDPQKTGAFIFQRRKELQLTQKELAQKLNVTDKAVSKWERGLSYPDITILSRLAAILAVTERELLIGQSQAAEPLPPDQPDLLVKDTLEYAKKAEHQHRVRFVTILMGLYTMALAIGVFVCLLCDGLLNGNFTWSLVVLVACLLGWAVIAPFYYLKTRRLFCSLTGASALTLLLLWVIQWLSPLSQTWYPWPALPILGASLAWVWIPTLLHTFTPISKWYLGSLAALLGIPCNICINWLANGVPFDLSSIPPMQQTSDFVSSLIFLVVSLTLFLLGWRHRRTK